MSFEGPVQIVGSLALMLACGYALLGGGRPERLAAVLIFLDWCLTPLLQAHDNFHHVQSAIFVLDGVTAALLTVLALTSKRYWPLAVAAFQLLELIMHLAMLIDHHVRPRAYWVGMEVGSYLMLAALAAGVWLEAPRRRLTFAASGP